MKGEIIMRMKDLMKKGIVTALIVSMSATVFTGCGSSDNGSTASNQQPETKQDTAPQQSEAKQDADQPASEADQPEQTGNDKPYDGVTLKWALTDNAATGEETQKMVALIKEMTGINIEFSITPTAAAGEIDKVLVSLMAGDDIDIVSRTPIQFEEFYNAGVLTPLDELAANVGYDMETVYSGAAVKFDGQTYALPAERDIWLTYYNKKVFDDAGIPYPEAEGWTWEKYVETAQQLNDAGKGVWGSFIGNDAVHSYMYATQSGVNPYKADGTSNFDDPAFAESMEWFFSLGNDLKIQPSSVEVASGTYPYNSFMIGDNIGLYVCGGWVASTLTTLEKYPRDWQAGILPMPYPEGSEPSSLVIDSCYAVPATSSNKEAAFEAIKCIAENKYTLGYGRIPAKTLTEDEARAYIEGTLVPMFEHDGITTEDFMAGWFDSSRNYISEKIVGTADTVINQIITEESLMYGQGAKSLEDTMSSIKSRADEAIKEAQAE